MDGVDPLEAVQLPNVKLLVSPVEPSSATHFGAAVDPSVTATFTVTDAPLLKSALDPPASPTTLNSV